MELSTCTLDVIRNTPNKHLVRMVEQTRRKGQEKLLSELLRHLLMSYVKTIKTDEFEKCGKSLLENGLEISFPHKNDLPDHIWGEIFKYTVAIGRESNSDNVNFRINFLILF